MRGLFLKAAFLLSYFIGSAVSFALQHANEIDEQHISIGRSAKERSSLGCPWWCGDHRSPWSEKCHWKSDACKVCKQCTEEEPSVPEVAQEDPSEMASASAEPFISAPSPAEAESFEEASEPAEPSSFAPPPAEAEPSEVASEPAEPAESSGLGCPWWCRSHSSPWAEKCEWKSGACQVCQQCGGDEQVVQGAAPAESSEMASTPAQSLPSDPPPSESSGSTRRVNFSGLRVALAWHGIYQRHQQSKHGGKVIKACSDFFSIASNVQEYITDPLTQAGAQVRNYVHTYHRDDCPSKDKALLDMLTPHQYDFWNVSNHRIVDSYIAVMRMVLEDRDELDFVVVLRYDVKYKVPITNWDITGNTIGLPYKDKNTKWDQCSQVSDLLYTFPINYTDPLIRALDWSGKGETSRHHTLRKGSEVADSEFFCNHVMYHGSGHFVMEPLVKELGRDAINIIADGFYPSDATIENTRTFLGIDRKCSEEYFNDCPNANTEWVEGGLWLLQKPGGSSLATM